MNKNKLKIGLTGGIGSGKSTVAKYLVEKGYKVIDADRVAKDILAKDNSVQKKIIEAFGKDSFKDNKLNVKYLSEKVFSDEKEVKRINSIVHPPTIKKIEKLMKKFLENNEIVFCESALIFEANMENLFDYVVCISAPEESRIGRVIERDKTDEEDVRNRISKQIPEKEKASLSDFTIKNDSDIFTLKKRVDFLLTVLNSLISKA